MEGPARSERRDAERGGVGAGARHVDGVVQPLAGARPSDVVAAIRARLEDDVGLPVDATFVAGRGVVIRDAFAAVIEVRRLNRSGNRSWRSEWRRCYGRRMTSAHHYRSAENRTARESSHRRSLDQVGKSRGSTRAGRDVAAEGARGSVR